MRRISRSSKPGGKSDVPAVPEVEEGGSGKWAIKIFRKANAQQPRECDDDIDIAREIRIKKEWIDGDDSEGGKKFDR